MTYILKLKEEPYSQSDIKKSLEELDLKISILRGKLKAYYDAKRMLKKLSQEKRDETI